ncbi:glycine N-acyltransferase-like protein 3 [Numida meleagris]|uniref:glycine N-acyltransferase-like protein 3 n=1 Tax=Numida meleagris TaxID=8996 RepID=UPI000B3DEA9F|nr:glycine N-acyltransferase-like protein 3 [Numida meleagris]
MRILTCPAQLQRLEAALRSSLPRSLPVSNPPPRGAWGRPVPSLSPLGVVPEPASANPSLAGFCHPLERRVLGLQVYGAVLNINRGNPGDFEVAVDTWPDFGAVLARRRGEAPVNDSYRSLHAAFYRDLGAYRALLESPGCMRWDTAFHIFGNEGERLQDGVLTASQDMALVKGVELEVTEYYTYLHPDPSTLPEPHLDPDVQLGALNPAHVDLLDSTWPYGGNAWSRRYLGELLRRFPHLCLHGSAGEPLCWVLSDGFAAGAHGYTVPAQRRRGFMRALTIMAARRAHARGFPAYGHTATGNRGMQRLQEELGHRRLPGLCRFVLHNPSLARAAP